MPGFNASNFHAAYTQYSNVNLNVTWHALFAYKFTFSTDVIMDVSVMMQIYYRRNAVVSDARCLVKFFIPSQHAISIFFLSKIKNSQYFEMIQMKLAIMSVLECKEIGFWIKFYSFHSNLYYSFRSAVEVLLAKQRSL